MKLHFTLTICFSIMLLGSIYPQILPEANPHRGLYVDHFLKVNGAGNPNPINSILSVDEDRDGIFEKEDALLVYCSENHITYLGLYDLWQVLGRNRTAWNENTKSYDLLEKHLCRFIEKAKNIYCVDQIGAIGSSAAFFDSVSTYMNRFPITDPYRLRPEQINSPFYNSGWDVVQHENPPGSIAQIISETLKLALRVSDFNSCGTCEADIDVINVESEFWSDCPTNFPIFALLLQHMDSVKQMHNSMYPNSPLLTEVYLGNMYFCSSPYGIIDVARLVDGCNSCSACPSCPNPTPRLIDRVLLSYLSPIPSNPGFFATFQFADPSTTDSTDFHPLLYSESLDLGGFTDYIGTWFPQSQLNNIFTAESEFYRAWRAQPATAITLPRESNLQLGGAMWFSQRFQVEPLHHPLTFYSPGPICDSTDSTIIQFMYTGPGEYGTSFDFNITRDSDGITVYPDTGNYISGITRPDALLNGINPNQTAINFTDTNLFPKCILQDGNYTAHLNLKYEFGNACNYLVEKSLTVDNKPRIQWSGDTVFCEGGYCWLHSSIGNSYQWYRNGQILPGANSQSYKAMKSGIYNCEITGIGGCNGFSDSIRIRVKPNPMIHINAHCNTNNTMTLIANARDTLTTPNEFGEGGVTYLWNTGSTNDRITVSYTGERYSVTVMNPYSGCRRDDEIFTTTAYSQPYSLDIVPLGIPSTSCSNDGAIRAVLNGSGTDPVTYSWNTGITTQNQYNLYPGTYSVVTSVWSRGCSYFKSYDLGPLPTGGPTITGVITNASCYGAADGSIQITTLGGNGPFTYYWDYIPEDSIHHPDSSDQSGLFPGIYTISVFDVSGCRFQKTFTVGISYPRLNVNLNSVTPVTICSANLNGAATVQASGGATPYQFVWNDVHHQQTPTADSLSSGTWRVICTDANGCSVTTLVSIPATPDMLITLGDSILTYLSCAGDSNGHLEVCISGATPPYAVDSPWTMIDSAHAELNNLTAGNYSIDITDTFGCTFSRVFNITEPLPLTYTDSVFGTTCIGCNDGIIQINPFGGTSPYSITLDPDLGITNGFSIDSLPAGVYTICLADAAGCILCSSATILEDPTSIPNDLFEEFSFEVFPNPTDGNVQVIIQGVRNFNEVQLQVFDLTGHELKVIPLEHASTSVSFSSVSNGIYFIRPVVSGIPISRFIKKLVLHKLEHN